MFNYIEDFTRAVRDLEAIATRISDYLNTAHGDLLPLLQNQPGFPSHHRKATLAAAWKHAKQLHDGLCGAAKKIQDLQLKMGARVNMLHNALAPINILVPDVIALIFEFVIEDEGHGDFPLSTPLVLSHVCSKWRHVIHSHAFLWSVQVQVSERTLDMAMRHVSLSRNNHLRHLLLDHQPVVPPWLRDGTLQAHVEKLTVNGFGPMEEALLFGGSFPRLYMLRLINESSPPSKLVFGSNRFALPPTTHLRLDDLDAPELDCLDLTQIAISSYGPTGLVLTHIDVNRASWGPDAWATLFVECGNLEVARFTKVEMEIGAIHPRQQPGQLRYLRLLQLDSCDSVSVSCALDMVNAPNLECLIIRAGEKNAYYGGETAVWRQIVDDAILKASLNRTPWTEDYLLRDTLWPHTKPRFTAFLGRSNRITDLLLIGHVDVMDNFLECLIGMPRNEALTHLKVAFFGVSVKPVNHSMFYIKRFIYHRHFNHGLRPVNLCLYGCGDPDRIFFAAMCNTVHLGRCLCETEPELTDEEPGEYETYVKGPDGVYDTPQLRASLSAIEAMMHRGSASVSQPINLTAVTQNQDGGGGQMFPMFP